MFKFGLKVIAALEIREWWRGHKERKQEKKLQMELRKQRTSMNVSNGRYAKKYLKAMYGVLISLGLVLLGAILNPLISVVAIISCVVFIIRVVYFITMSNREGI